MDLRALATANFKLAAICDLKDHMIYIPLVAVPGEGMRAVTCDEQFQQVNLWQFEDETDAAKKLTEIHEEMTSKPLDAA